MTTATVRLWGTTIGYASMGHDETFARFEYDPAFVDMGIDLAPLMMPAEIGKIYRFPELHPRSFHGLPGLLSDSLPDKYGNRLIDVWLAQTGRSATEFNAVDRLCYVGVRGMGALEFEPPSDRHERDSKDLQVQDLVELASIAFASKKSLDVKLGETGSDQGLLDILSVGASAGGARAKAVIAYNEKTKTLRSGQLDLTPGYEHWLIKFDGVKYSGDWGIADPAGYGLLEYSYHQMAKECDIDMMECRLLSENGRHHFMTRRFDRNDDGEKYFVQTLAALNHFDYFETGAYSYEQIIMMMRQLKMPMDMIEQQVRRTIFNLVGCNQDDHVKNFGFMMDRQGMWSLTPAYDLCHSEGSEFTKTHQLSLNGKLKQFTMTDLKHLEEYAGLPRNFHKRVLEKTLDAFTGWERVAKDLEIPTQLRKHVLNTLRMNWG
ncbi:MAG: serine/threonine-protein kinase HipA [Pseudohongiellaceae bacterium]|jgi:serine/threonine-protein kinase HipA